MSSLRYHIDNIDIKEKKIIIMGWAFSHDKKQELKISIENEKFIKRQVYRGDVVEVFKHEGDINQYCGFEIQCDYSRQNKIKIIFEAGRDLCEHEINVKLVKKQLYQAYFNKVIKLIKRSNIKNIEKSYRYLKRYGIKAFLIKLKNVSGNTNQDYNKWFNDRAVTQIELQEQAKKRFKDEPLISIVVPTYNTPEKFLVEMIESVKFQSYSNWELCIVDGGSSNKKTIDILKKYSESDKRIVVNYLSKNLGIVGNSNEGLKMVRGEYIGLLDHDDILTLDALYEIVKAINENDRPDFIYTDEDKINEAGNELFDPHFKPDFAPDNLRTRNYICHFSVYSKKLLDKIGGFNKEYEGSQDYDLVLRATENANKVVHIPKILYHWRTHMNSVALNAESKLYAFESAKKALSAHLSRLGIKGEVSDGIGLGCYNIKYELIGNPLISIVIPNKDHIKDLSRCIESIMKKTTYTNIEIIIVENNSVTKEIRQYYNDITRVYTNVKVIEWKEGFNYSKINNFGVEHANGEYIVLLNNDTEVISPNWLEEMLGYCQRTDVGIVGAKLYYEDNKVQHAGVLIGIAGTAGHAHYQIDKEDIGYFARAKLVQNFSAVTGACLMIKKDLFIEVGGLTEELSVAFNDIDLCLKVRDKNYLIVFTPFAELYHYESRSRGYEDSKEKIKRFELESDLFRKRWINIIKKGDPYYNINLTNLKGDFSLKNE